MSTLDEPIDGLYDDIRNLSRKVLDIERDYRDLAERDDIAVDTLGASIIPGEALAVVTESLTALRRTLDDAENHRAQAKRAASRLYIDRT